MTVVLCFILSATSSLTFYFVCLTCYQSDCFENTKSNSWNRSTLKSVRFVSYCLIHLTSIEGYIPVTRTQGFISWTHVCMSTTNIKIICCLFYAHIALCESCAARFSGETCGGRQILPWSSRKSYTNSSQIMFGARHTPCLCVGRGSHKLQTTCASVKQVQHATFWEACSRLSRVCGECRYVRLETFVNLILTITTKESQIPAVSPSAFVSKVLTMHEHMTYSHETLTSHSNRCQPKISAIERVWRHSSNLGR